MICNSGPTVRRHKIGHFVLAPEENVNLYSAVFVALGSVLNVLSTRLASIADTDNARCPKRRAMPYRAAVSISIFVNPYPGCFI